MKITYIHHSGFLVETAECYCLFDYYKGELPSLDPAKPMLVFVSHSHQDHYNPAVFALLLEKGIKKAGAILPNDIKPRNYPEGWSLLPGDGGTASDRTAPDKRDASTHTGIPASSGCTDINALNNHILKVYHSREYDLPCHIHIRTLLSTDSGVAFLLRCPEGTFYHAGDLNDWISDNMPEAERRQMTGSFRAALRPLKDISIDHACLPLDPHLGSHYADGFLYFLKQISTKKVYPMHFWDDTVHPGNTGDMPETVGRFLREHPEYKETLVWK